MKLATIQAITPKQVQKYFSSDFTLTILSLIGQGLRPYQIAKKHGRTQQAINHHTRKLRELGFIVKEGDRNGLIWKVTDRGLLLLKESHRPSVNGSVSGSTTPSRPSYAAVRLHDVAFAFPIQRVPDEVDLKWAKLKNGVEKCSIDHSLGLDDPLISIEQKKVTCQLVRSPHPWNSSMILQMGPQHFTNPLKGIIQLHNDARVLASDLAHKYRLNINLTRSSLVKNPHMAFTRDLTAILLSNIVTAKVSLAANQKNGRCGSAWLDNSLGHGELETDDFDYYWNYLMMPKTVEHIAEMLERITSSPPRPRPNTPEYQHCYDATHTYYN